jgi:hypothetical protein
VTKKSGLADSPFFVVQRQTPPSPAVKPDSERVNAVPRVPDSAPPSEPPEQQKESPSIEITGTSSNRDTTIPRHHDTTVSRYHDALVELVRKAVKEFGKEAATHRFTPEEKKAIADIIYAYKALGVKTSENEIARISINFLVQDYRENGQNSILDKVLRALNE